MWQLERVKVTQSPHILKMRNELERQEGTGRSPREVLGQPRADPGLPQELLQTPKSIPLMQDCTKTSWGPRDSPKVDGKKLESMLSYYFDFMKVF